MSKTRSKRFKKQILEGQMLAIDPSSGATGHAGWALFTGGRLVESGILKLAGSEFNHRLKAVLKDALEFDPVDVLVIEKIGGYRAQSVLIQACGVFIAGIDSPNCIQMNVQTWQAIAKRVGGWKKTTKKGLQGDPNGQEGDEYDAIYIGAAAIALALGYDSKAKEEDREPYLTEVRERIGWIDQQRTGQ